MGSRPSVKRTDGPAGKDKSKERLNESAFAVPVAVAVLPASLPEFTPNITFDFHTGGWSDSPSSGDSGTPVAVRAYEALPQIESVAAAGDAIPTGAAGGAGAGSDSFLEGAPGSTRAQGETAFEARIQLPASNVPDKPEQSTPGTKDGPADGQAGADPVANNANSASGPLIATSLSHPSPALSHPGAVQVGNPRDAGNAEPVKSPGKTPAADETSQELAGQEQQDSASPGKESDETARAPLENSLRTAEPQISGATVSAAVPTGSSESTAATKSEPSVGTAVHDAGADAGSPPPAGAPARDIAIQLQDPGGPRVDVQLMDRGGTVHVVVRTQDDALAKDLRTNLPDLAQKLSQQGMEADAWSPLEMHNTSVGHENPGQAREQTARDAHSSAGGQGSGGSDGDQPQGQHPDPDDEFEQSFSGLLTGVTAWQPTR
jgi:hypothetical protein